MTVTVATGGLGQNEGNAKERDIRGQGTESNLAGGRTSGAHTLMAKTKRNVCKRKSTPGTLVEQEKILSDAS